MRNHRAHRLAPVLLSLAMIFSLLAVPASAAEGGKTDVWDFGAEQLDATQYNNKLTVEEINSWYPASVAPGSEGNTIASFTSSDGELSFNDGGKPATHRLRTMNTALTRRDAKSLTGADGTVYNGYIYSNSGANPDVYVSLNCSAGDTVTVIVGSNGGDSTINFEGPSGVESSGKFLSGGAKAQELKFYPKETGTYKFYSTDEKLVIARIYRGSAQTVTVSGAVTAPAALSGYSVAFTNTENGAVTSAAVSDGKYTAQLQVPFTYDVSLLNANGYIVTSENKLTVDAAKTLDVTVQAVDLVTVKGNITGLSADALAKLNLKFAADTVYVPTLTVDGGKYTAVLEKGVSYALTAQGVNDYALTSANTISYPADATADIAFAAKPRYKVWVAPIMGTKADMAEAGVGGATYTFTNLDEEGYVYTFDGMEGIALRDGRYSLEVTGLKNGYVQKLTPDVVVNGADVNPMVGYEKPDTTPVAYKANLTVGKSGCDYQSVGDALAAIRRMERPNGERVTVSIQPGNYEEMLVVDVPNVSLVNSSATPSTAITGKGVDIDPNAVRITWYYGHGYNYYSMGDDCKYNAELLEVNKQNGRESFTNPGAGSTNGSYWNSSVVVSADGFEARGIIFENSFNQYISPKSLEDVIVNNGAAKEGATPRAELKTAGDTAVQDKAYVERAGALAITNNCKNIYFENCKFIGRQDTLFGGAGTTAAFYGCQVVGSTDYIYGPMTAVFAKCDLVFNTSENSNDRGYVTAPQHTAGRGFLLYNCNITSTTPGVDTASAQVSKPGYFGRPWTANTGEAVFFETVIGTASDGSSLIHPDGWLNTLSGTSALCGEYNTHELTAGVDNSTQRVAWCGKFDGGKLTDGTPITVEAFLGDWKPFEGKDMSISTAGTAPAVPSGTGFADVPADLYCAQAVTWAVDNKVTTGTSATTFSPTQTCTVKEILTFLWRAKGEPEAVVACPFSEVDPYGPYYDALCWAEEVGLLGAETTSANQPCTRAMVCTYLWRAAGSPQVRHAALPDVPGDSFALNAISWALEAGITNGTGVGFSPDRVCSRGEIITFLYRSQVQSLGK